jgi:hypothetical protein
MRLRERRGFGVLAAFAGAFAGALAAAVPFAGDGTAAFGSGLEGLPAWAFGGTPLAGFAATFAVGWLRFGSGFFGDTAFLTFLRAEAAAFFSLAAALAGAAFFLVLVDLALLEDFTRLAGAFFLVFPAGLAADFFPFALGISNSHRLACSAEGRKNGWRTIPTATG